jgi:xylulokinase
MSVAIRPAAYVGVDLGTSGLKITVVGSDGAVLAEAEEGYGVRAALPGHAETDPRDWADAFDRAAKRLSEWRQDSPSAPPIAAVGVTGQMHGIVLTDPEGRPVRPALLWPDQRAAGTLARWRDLPADVRSRLGNPLVAGMAGPLLTWLRHHEPGSLDASTAVASPKDWLRRELTGATVTERSDASATLLWDVVADDWSPEALALAGITRDALGTVVRSDAVVGTTGHPTLTGGVPVPVVAGAADTAAALLALESCGAVPSWRDAAVVNAGTGIQIVRPGARPAPRVDPVTHLYADATGGWYEMLAIQNGGFALTWAQRILGATWEESVALAREAPAGSSGAVFVPFLTGERGGVAPPGASAGWTSLTPSTGRAELLRAAFEGFAFTIRRGLQMLGEHTGPVLLSGGGGREPWVRQLVADVLDRPVTYVPMRSASAVGAAILAARAVGEQLAVAPPVVQVEPAGGAHREALAAAYDAWLTALNSAESRSHV